MLLITQSQVFSIPAKGPLIMIANHPFGIIDGLIMCSLASKVRSDFKILTHETLQFLPELEKYILPIDFSENKKKETIKNNIKTTQEARKHLLNNGLLIIFPSGSVSISKDFKSAAEDDEWKQFTAKILKQTKSDILPIYFDGKNGLLFHVFASKLKNQTLKYSSYIHETKKMIGKELIKYIQCYGCRNPITMKDTKLKSYVKGVSCKHCYNKGVDFKNKDQSLDRCKSNLQRIIVKIMYDN